ncbi:unnamed protein product [Echinostoma caproni]|uniref:Rep_fac_C domain-containing protein n=1 Tax=Echinostoma caproni TaxID=27848 RepID=A0A183BAV2_9TREM|nr:unnamed protein product [Echinostoma caproni]
MLQSVCQLMNPSTVDSTCLSTKCPTITSDQLDEVAAVVPSSLLDKLLQSAKTGRFDEVQSSIKDLLMEGHSAHQAVDQCQELILADENMPDHRKGPMLEALAVRVIYFY